MDRDAISARSLAYHQEQQCDTQWRDFLSVLVAELGQLSGREESLEFFRHLGHRLAERLPLREQDTLQGLEQAINEHWRRMDWGWCLFSAQQNMITILHGAWPELDKRPGCLWPQALASLLEGVYERWLRGQGGGEVSVKMLSAVSGEPMEFCYGR